MTRPSRNHPRHYLLAPSSEAPHRRPCVSSVPRRTRCSVAHPFFLPRARAADAPPLPPPPTTCGPAAAKRTSGALVSHRCLRFFFLARACTLCRAVTARATELRRCLRPASLAAVRPALRLGRALAASARAMRPCTPRHLYSPCGPPAAVAGGGSPASSRCSHAGASAAVTHTLLRFCVPKPPLQPRPARPRRAVPPLPPRRRFH